MGRAESIESMSTAEYPVIKEIRCNEQQGKRPCWNVIGHVYDVHGAIYAVPHYYFRPPGYDVGETGILSSGDFKEAVRLTPNQHDDPVTLADYAGEPVLFPGICRDPNKPDAKRGKHDGISRPKDGPYPSEGIPGRLPPNFTLQRARAGMVLDGNDLADPERFVVRATFPKYGPVVTTPAYQRLREWLTGLEIRMRERQQRSGELWGESIAAARAGDWEQVATIDAELKALAEADDADRRGPARPFPVDVEWTANGPSPHGSAYDMLRPSPLMRMHTTTNRAVPIR